MNVIGITGRVGSGKSHLVSLISERYKLPVIDLDSVGHDVLRDENVVMTLSGIYGKEILDPDGLVDRKRLGKIVFGSSSKLDTLNEIVHPLLKAKVLSILDEISGSGDERHILLVGALISEIGLRGLINVLIVLDATDEASRLAVGDKFLIAKHQRSREAFKKDADFILVNDYSVGFDERAVAIFEGLLVTK